MRRGDETIFQGNGEAMEGTYGLACFGKVLVKELGAGIGFWEENFRQAVCLSLLVRYR